MLYRMHLAWAEFELARLVVIGTYKLNYHTITTSPEYKRVFSTQKLRQLKSHYISFITCSVSMHFIKITIHYEFVHIKNYKFIQDFKPNYKISRLFALQARSCSSQNRKSSVTVQNPFNKTHKKIKCCIKQTR